MYTYVPYLEKVKMQKKTKVKNLNFRRHLESHRQNEQDPDLNPNPWLSGTDPRIRIRTKMSRITSKNTLWYTSC